MKKDFLNKKAQRYQEQIARRKEEAELRVQTEKTKTELKIGLLKLKLQNEEALFEEKEEERVEYLAAYEDQIQQYLEPSEANDKKAEMMVWCLLTFDLITGVIIAGIAFAESPLLMIAISLSMTALFYFTGKITAKVAKDPDANEADKQVKGALLTMMFLLLLGTSIIRAMQTSEGEGIGMTIFIFIAMLCIGTIAYQITCSIFYETYKPIKIQIYHSLYQLAQKHDKQRIDLHEEIVNEQLALTEIILSNQLELNRAIEQIEDNLDNANITDVFGTGEESLPLLINGLAQPSSASNNLIIQAQTGTEHYSLSAPMLSIITAFLEDSYIQSRIIKPLFEAIRHTRKQAHDTQHLLSKTNSLAHTDEISFLKISSQQIRANTADIIAFIDHHCQRETLDGVEIIFAHNSKNESKYDQHRVEMSGDIFMGLIQMSQI